MKMEKLSHIKQMQATAVAYQPHAKSSHQDIRMLTWLFGVWTKKNLRMYCSGRTKISTVLEKVVLLPREQVIAAFIETLLDELRVPSQRCPMVSYQ